MSDHARVKFDGNQYSTPVEVVGKPVMVRADTDTLRVLHEGREVARHHRSYGKMKVIRDAEHELQALRMRKRNRAHHLEETFETYDAAYVETLLLQERRRRELPSPTPLCPARRELLDEIDIEPSDPAVYDRLFGTDDQETEDYHNKEDSQHDQT